MTSKLLVDKHVASILALDNRKESLDFWLLDHLKISGLYWGITALALLDKLDSIKKEDILDFVVKCQCENGGFSGNIGHDPHLLYTLSAVQILVMYNSLQIVDVEKIVKYVKGLQQDDGSFFGDEFGEVDTRFSYCAISCLSLLQRLDEINVDKAIEFILQCQNFDGGFGSVPGAESHAGQIFCCVGALSIVEKEFEEKEKKGQFDLLGWWIAERQLPNGGLNGRPEKLEDVCYSWWCLSSLSLMKKIHWINQEKLTEFILSCQDGDNGGISDRSGNVADVYHTLFGIAGLSLMNYQEKQGDNVFTLKPVHPAYCMPMHLLPSHILEKIK